MASDEQSTRDGGPVPLRRVPLGDLDLGLPLENLTSYSAPGQMIVYPEAA